MFFRKEFFSVNFAEQNFFQVLCLGSFIFMKKYVFGTF